MVRQTLALITLGVIIVSGCTALRPDYMTAGYAHQSQPFRGSGPAPLGGHGAETNYDALSVGARWERGPVWWEANGLYMLHESNVTGGPWATEFRGGIKVKLP